MIQQGFAKQKKYAEAHQVQQVCQNLEIVEREKYMKDRHKKIIAAEAKLIQKQQLEMNALKKKLEGNLNERLKLRENEHNKLLQRYQNVKKEIENQQNLERIKYEKAFKAHNIGGARPGTGFNSMMTSKMN
jgi:restriction endonuclease